MNYSCSECGYRRELGNMKGVQYGEGLVQSKGREGYEQQAHQDGTINDCEPAPYKRHSDKRHERIKQQRPSERNPEALKRRPGPVPRVTLF